MNIRVFALRSGEDPVEETDMEMGVSLDQVTMKLPHGVYSTFRTFDHATKALDLQSHLSRIYNPSMSSEIKPSKNPEQLRIHLRALLADYYPNDVRVRIYFSMTDPEGTIYIMIEPLRELAEQVFTDGVKVVCTKTERLTPRLKSTAFIEQTNLERKMLLNNDIFEALMVHDGCILEGFTSNFYALSRGKVITARKNILLGVTRKIALRLIRKEGVEIIYNGFRIDKLRELDEAFISSSSRGVVPVTMIDNIPVGEGVPGKLSAKLQKDYEDYVRKTAKII